MTALRGLYERVRLVGNEVMKFGAVGAVGTVVNFAVFNLCLHAFDLQTVRSGVIATTVAIGANYLGNRYWTYRSRDKSQQTREVSLFVLFSGIGMVIENGVLALSHYGFDFTSTLADNVAKYVVGLGLGTVFRFWSYRTWVFRRTQDLRTVQAAEKVLAASEPAGRVRTGGPAGRAGESTRRQRITTR